MRTTADRIRHALSFEAIGLVVITPLGGFLFGLPLFHMGIIGIVSAAIATAWNYIFNLLFDLVLRWRTGDTRKSLGLRIGHAIVFEIGLLSILLPFLAWYLGVGIVEAFTMDIAVAAFYMGYAFIFNWAYDRLFPLPEWRQAAG